MSSLEQISKAVIERVELVLPEDWERLWYTPTNESAYGVPALCLRPDDNMNANYQQTLGSGYTRWFLRAGLYVDAADEESAQSLLSDLTDPDGPLISTLLDSDLNGDPDGDSLAQLCGMNVAVTDGRRWKPARRRRLSCDIGLVLGAN